MPTYEFSAFVTSTADTEQEARTKAEELTHATSRSPEGVRVSLNDGSAAIVDDDTPGNIAIDEIADGRDYRCTRCAVLTDRRLGPAAYRRGRSRNERASQSPPRSSERAPRGRR